MLFLRYFESPAVRREPNATLFPAVFCVFQGDAVQSGSRHNSGKSEHDEVSFELSAGQKTNGDVQCENAPTHPQL